MNSWIVQPRYGVHLTQRLKRVILLNANYRVSERKRGNDKKWLELNFYLKEEAGPFICYVVT